MAEVMLLNVARWLKTRPLQNRVVYDVHDRSAPCETLFDAARHLVFADASHSTCSEPPSPSLLPPSPRPELSLSGAAGEETDAAGEEERDGEPLEWSIGALPQVERRRLSAGTPMSCRVQRDSDNDMSDNDEVDGEDGSGGSGGEGEAGEQDCDDGLEEDLDAAELLSMLENDEASDSPLLADDAGNGSVPDSSSPLLEGEAASGPAHKEDSVAEPGGFFAKLAAALPPGLESLALSDGSDVDRAASADRAGDLSSGGGWAVTAAARAGNMSEGGGAGGAIGGARGAKTAGREIAASAGVDVGASHRDKGAKTGSSAKEGLSLSERTLLFDSRFEGGNLARAVQVHELEYDLYLMPDINTKAAASGGNTQWYYFAVSNMEVGVEYKMNIVNLVKPDSLYNAGMRPALYSITDAGSVSS